LPDRIEDRVDDWPSDWNSTDRCGDCGIGIDASDQFQAVPDALTDDCDPRHFYAPYFL